MHRREIPGMAGVIDLDDQTRHAGEIARTFLDQGDTRQFRQGDCRWYRDVGAGARIEIEHLRQGGFPRDRFEIGEKVAFIRRAAK